MLALSHVCVAGWCSCSNISKRIAVQCEQRRRRSVAACRHIRKQIAFAAGQASLAVGTKQLYISFSHHLATADIANYRSTRVGTLLT